MAKEKMSAQKKTFLTLMGAHYLFTFLATKEERKVLNEEQTKFVSYELSICPKAKRLAAQGYSAKEISDTLECHKMTPEKFETLTGKRWPK